MVGSRTSSPFTGLYTIFRGLSLPDIAANIQVRWRQINIARFDLSVAVGSVLGRRLHPFYQPASAWIH